MEGIEESKGKIEFEYSRLLGKVIIVVTGLPCTGKSQLAYCIGQWVGCQVCYIDDFLQALSLEKQYTSYSPPSREEDERIHRLTLVALYNAAFRYQTHSKCVVIMSGLSTTFELDLLVNLFRRGSRESSIESMSILIIECRMQNEYRWRNKVEGLRRREVEEWYKVRSWKDIEKAKEDCLSSHSLDLHLHASLTRREDFSYFFYRFPYITRLVLDYSDDFRANPGEHLYELTVDFQRALKYILEEQKSESKKYRRRAAYVLEVQFKDMRRYLLEKELDAPTERREYLCNGENNTVGCCIFKYWEELPGEEVEASYCRVCDEEMVIGEAAYTCHFCILNLHSYCAEFVPDRTFLKDVHKFKPFSYRSTLCGCWVASTPSIGLGSYGPRVV